MGSVRLGGCSQSGRWLCRVADVDDDDDDDEGAQEDPAAQRDPNWIEAFIMTNNVHEDDAGCAVAYGTIPWKSWPNFGRYGASMIG